MERLKFWLEFLSPVHIGTGDVIYPHEYAILDNVFYKVDIGKLLSSPRWGQYMNVKDSNIVEIRKRFLRVFKEMMRFNAHEDFVEYKFPVDDDVTHWYESKLGYFRNQMEVHTFIRNSSFYIPGSSIKGAIRTAFLEEVASEDKVSRWGAKCRNSRGKEISALLEHCVMDAIDEANNRIFPLFEKTIFNYLRISDVRLEDNDISIYQVRNVSIKTGKEGIPAIFEGTRFSNEIVSVKSKEGEISLDDKRYEIGANGLFNLRNVLKTVDDIYKDKFYREFDYIKKLSGNNIKIRPLIDFYDRLSDRISNLKRGEYLIRLGRFSGFRFVTVSTFRKLGRNKDSKTVNLVEGGRWPFGWVIITNTEL